MKPSAVNKTKDTITYAIVDSRLGRLLIAGTGQGVCAVRLGDDDAKLEGDLHEEFPNATLVRSDEVNGWVPPFQAYLAGERASIDVPLDVAGTDFQQRVWNELRNIPYGETRSYRDVAEALGMPKGSRAVGTACAVNPVSLIVPCHRVLQSGGRLGGYAFGLHRKDALLAMEKGLSM